MAERNSDESNLAIFCDFENVAIGVREARFDEFDMHLVLERLLDKGRIVVKKAYADWERYKPARRALHEAAFELIEVPHVSYSGKNSADIRMVVDALDLCYVKHHVDVFVVVSGDSDFSPLVSKLRENNKRVIGLGVKSSTSDLLIENCDEFIYYDDLVRSRRETRRSHAPEGKGGRAPAPKPPSNDKSPRPDETRRTGGPPEMRPRIADERAPVPPSTEAKGRPLEEKLPPTANALEAKGKDDKVPPSQPAPAPTGEPRGRNDERPATPEGENVEKSLEQRQLDALEMVLDVVEGLFQDREGNVWGSMVKQALKRKRPNFSERFHGYRTFNDLLEDAGKRGLLEMHFDEKSGGIVISDFGPNS